MPGSRTYQMLPGQKNQGYHSTIPSKKRHSNHTKLNTGNTASRFFEKRVGAHTRSDMMNTETEIADLAVEI